MQEEKNKGGRPLKFKSVRELEEKIEQYFLSLYEVAYDQFGNPIKDKFYKPPKEDEPEDTNPFAGYIVKKVRVATVTGLAVYLDTFRDVLIDYENGKYDDRDEDGKPIELTDQEKDINQQIDSFSNTIKKAKAMIYADTEQQLHKPGAATGAIFSLKNNYQWTDKSITEHTNPDGSLSPIVRIIDERQDK